MADGVVPAPPERYHDANHGPISFEDCWQCQRACAICRSKRSYGTREAADAAVREVNEAEGYRRPVVRYRCRWCLAWHLTTAQGKHERRRAEKQRRRWLVAARTAEAKPLAEGAHQKLLKGVNHD